MGGAESMSGENGSGNRWKVSTTYSALPDIRWGTWDVAHRQLVRILKAAEEDGIPEAGKYLQEVLRLKRDQEWSCVLRIGGMNIDIKLEKSAD